MGNRNKSEDQRVAPVFSLTERKDSQIGETFGHLPGAITPGWKTPPEAAEQLGQQ